MYQEGANENDTPMILEDPEVEPILVYGKSKEIHHMPYVFKHNLFTMKKEFNFEPVHPCPKQYSLWLDILRRSRARNVLDPFMGSGTTAQAAEELGIFWVGFELHEEYHVDIDKRVFFGRQKRDKVNKKRALSLDDVMKSD
jgi:DNA modification methylase